MYDMGYCDIHNIDISETVIKQYENVKLRKEDAVASYECFGFEI